MDCDKRVYTSSRQPCWNLPGTLLEPSWEPCWNLAGTLLEPSWNLAGTLLEPSFSLAGTLLEPSWNLAGTLLEPCLSLPGTFLEPCWNLAGTFLQPCCNPAVTFLRTLLQLPNSDPLGFQSFGRGVVPAKCMLWKTGKLSLAATLLESRWSLARAVLEPSCHLGETWNLAGKSLGHCWNSAGTWWTLAGTWWNLAGTSLEPCCWNLWLEYFARNQCGCPFRFSFYIVSCFA